MLPAVPEESLARTYRWYLESLVEGGRQLRRIAVHPLPFRVGRLQGLGLTLASDSVSKEHAEFSLAAGALRLRDLGSRNGTFVNSSPVDDVVVLREGDIVHFAQVEFRVGRQEIDPEAELVEPATVALDAVPLPQRFVEGVQVIPELLRERQVTCLFQPIVTLPSATLAGYEAFGRGLHPSLPPMPLDLFRIATAAEAQAQLSQVFREKAVELASSHPRFPALFLNVHPAELATASLVPALVATREALPQLRLTIEIHEGALADLAAIDGLRTQLSRCGVALAYDDFGSGQARLLELAEVPPHYLKFDMSFIRGVNAAPSPRQRLLTSLVSVARDLLVYTVAEGVETAEEADLCMHVGFTHAQGFFFGRPRPIEEI